MSEAKENGIFINGKKQIIELLQFMDPAEKNKLINNMRIKNAAMAKELSEQSLSFKDLFQLNDHILTKIFTHVNPTILGLALYLTPMKYQRRALSLIARDGAEQAFQIMGQNLSFKKDECLKAQTKIIGIAIQLSKRNLINL